MVPYKYGDIKISVTCDMTQDLEMQAAIEHLKASKERLEAVKKTIVPQIEAIGEARLTAIIQQLRGLLDTKHAAGISGPLVVSGDFCEAIYLRGDGRLEWRPGYDMPLYTCNINDPMIRQSELFQHGISADGIITKWNEKRVYECLREALLKRIASRANDNTDLANNIEQQFRAVIKE